MQYNSRKRRVEKRSLKISILVLGSGESGKSTVVKQMRIIHAAPLGFSLEERGAYKDPIFAYVLEQMKLLVCLADRHKMTPSRPELERVFTRIRLMELTERQWGVDLASDLVMLWRDEAMQRVYYTVVDPNFQMDETAAYFFNSLTRMLQSSTYLPNNQDILRLRVKTSGIERMNLPVNGVDIEVTDIGGQTLDRGLWVRCMKSKDVIIYCVSLSEYDQVMREDHSKSRMEDSLMQFTETMNANWVENTNVIILFTKLDLFAEKIKYIDLSLTFPMYRGGLGNLMAASHFIHQMFIDAIPHNRERMVFSHFLCALDTLEIPVVFRDTREILLNKLLNGGYC